MNLGTVLYYSLCHGLVIAGILFSFLPPFTAGSGRTRALHFRGLLIAMGITTAAMTYNFFQNAADEPINRIILIARILSLLGLLGLCGIIAFIPHFFGSFSTKRKASSLSKTITIIAVGLAPFQIILVLPRTHSIILFFQTAFSLLDIAFLVGSISWSAWIGIIALKNRNREEGEHVFPWYRLLNTMLTAGLFLTPLIIANDFLQIPSRLFGKTPPNLLPLLSTVWSLAFILLGLKTLSIPQKRPPAFSPEKATWESSALTPRETEIARLVISGYSYKMIAERLGIALSTVKTHVLKVYSKTGAGNKIELLNFTDQ